MILTALIVYLCPLTAWNKVAPQKAAIELKLPTIPPNDLVLPKC